jgi:phenylacetate-coenzyme A ligase PaaK-like adenylate-forming protein/DNA-binding MarR family transcriptional regulator
LLILSGYLTIVGMDDKYSPQAFQVLNTLIRIIEKYNLLEKNPRVFGGGITVYPSQMRVIDLAGRCPGINITELARRLEITRASASELAARLVNGGLIRKGRDEGNNKEVALYITDDCRPIFEEINHRHAKMFAELNSLLAARNETDFDSVITVLQKIDSFLAAFIAEDRPGPVKSKETAPDVLPHWNYTQEYEAESRQIMETCLEKVPMYRDWRALDPGPGFPVDERYAALPALTKKMVRDHFPDGTLPAGLELQKGLDSGDIQLVETSGTTDDKITNIWNQQWWNASEAASWKLNGVLSQIATGYHHEAILVNPKNVGIKSDKVDLPFEKRRLGRFLYLNEKTDPLAWTPALMDRMIKDMERFQPVILEANPSYLARLCRYIADSGKTVFQPRAIVFTYEFAAGFHYRQIRKVFNNTPLISSYGTTETGYVFLECQSGKLHQNSDYCRVDFQPFKPEYGGPRTGRILVTPLQNTWSYYLRFDTGDIVQIAESGKCACGREHGIVLSAIAGRQANLTLTTAGRPVTLQQLDTVMDQLGDFEMFRLEQTDAGTYELYLVSRRKDTARLNKKAESILKDLYGAGANITVFNKADIAPSASGKYLISRAAFPIDLNEYLDVAKGKNNE